MAAEVDHADGRPVDALRRVDEALTQSAATGELWYDGGLLRLRAVLLRDLGKLAESEDCLLSALTTVEQQGAQLFGPAIAVELAPLWEKQGRSKQVKSLLRRFK
jgi:hypothetical protein